MFPLLVLWANLHGSVTLGAAMAVIYGGLLLIEGFRAQRWRGLAHRRGLAFLIGGPLCLLITPYGLSIIDYYRATLFNPEFSKLVTEWQPVTAYMILAVPLLLLIVGTVWAIGRSGSQDAGIRPARADRARARRDLRRAEHHLVRSGGDDAASDDDHRSGAPQAPCATPHSS